MNRKLYRRNDLDDAEEGAIDYDLQTAYDSKGRKTLQMVAMNPDGTKVILKEFEGMSIDGMERTFEAPKKSDHGNKAVVATGSFMLGLIIGGFLVFLYMKNKDKIADGVRQFSAPRQQVQPQQVIVEAPRPAEYESGGFLRSDPNAWSKEYNRMFTTSEGLEDMF